MRTRVDLYLRDIRTPVISWTNLRTRYYHIPCNFLAISLTSMLTQHKWGCTQLIVIWWLDVLFFSLTKVYKSLMGWESRFDNFWTWDTIKMWIWKVRNSPETYDWKGFSYWSKSKTMQDLPPLYLNFKLISEYLHRRIQEDFSPSFQLLLELSHSYAHTAEMLYSSRNDCH